MYPHTEDCMCGRCVSARKAALRPLDPHAKWHGTTAGYTNHACRSECCLSAARAAKRKYRMRKAIERWNQPESSGLPTKDALTSQGQ